MQLWFFTNGRSLVQASYVCPWADRQMEAEAREAILHRNAAAIMGRAGEDVVGAKVAA